MGFHNRLRLLKYRNKSNKGFTLVELIVVLALMAIIMAMVFYQPNGSDERKADANAKCRLFFLQAQNVYADYDLDIKNGLSSASEYAVSVDDKRILIMAETDPKNGGFKKVKIEKVDTSDFGTKFKNLVKDFSTLSENSTYEKRLKDDLSVRLPDVKEGFFYAIIDNKNRVETVHYKQRNFSVSDFDNNLTFISDYYTPDGIVGTYSNNIEIGLKDKRVFNLPH